MKQGIATLMLGVKKIFLSIFFLLKIVAFGSEFYVESPLMASHRKASERAAFNKLEKLLPKNAEYGKWYSIENAQYSHIMCRRTITDTVKEISETFYGIPFDMPSRWWNYFGCFSDKCLLAFAQRTLIMTETIFAKFNTGEEKAIATKKFAYYHYLQIFDDNGEPIFIKDTAYIPRLDADTEDDLLDPVFPKACLQ